MEDNSVTKALSGLDVKNIGKHWCHLMVQRSFQ